MFTVGNHLVEDFTSVFRFKSAAGAIVEHDEYQVAVERLIKAGYHIRDGEAGWEQFAELRAKYAAMLNQMAHLLAIPPAQWIGDRSYLPHRPARSRRRKH
jgi:hypothetical protein